MKKMMLKKALRSYIICPLILSIILVGAVIYVLFRDSELALILGIVVAVYILALVVYFFARRKRIMGELVRFATDYGQKQRALLGEMAIPYAVLDTSGRIMFANRKFTTLVETEECMHRTITSLFPDITKDILPTDENVSEVNFKVGGRGFKAQMNYIRMQSLSEDSFWNRSGGAEPDESDALIALYLYDETEVLELKQANIDQKTIIGLLYIDNYEEALESIDEVRRSLLTALVDRKINKYFQGVDAIIRKLEKDKYFFIFKNMYLESLKEAKFSILDEVRSVNIGNDMSVTISMGISTFHDSFTSGYEAARAAMDLALGRGGDQVVIKDKEGVIYYGGKSASVEKSTRVKARVKAHALREFIEAKERVIIMGHSMGDADSFGSSVGVYRIAKTLGKKAHIVVSEITTSMRAVVNRFVDNPDYDQDMMIGSAQALEYVDDSTLLVVVDVNRPSYTECPQLIDKAKTIVVLDHHRQTGEAIEKAVLSYVEPYASSACEMVAEILQYIDEGLKLKPAEADAMYSGIMIDTNNFLTKTGVRTFEAAAYLRRSGADVTRIRKAFRTELPEYMAKASAIASAETFLDHYAFSACEAGNLESPTIIGAQVANELLDIVGIRASFVFTAYNGKIYVSARSIDELNVQVVMEKLGGGGHMSVAGVQFADCTVDEAMNRVKNVLEEMTKNGEID